MLSYWAHAEQRAAAGVLNSGIHAHVAAYPEVIATAATLLTIGPQLEYPCALTQSGMVALLINRINERTGARHTDSTPVEQWVQNRDWSRPVPKQHL